jgi:hypothetical protein
MARFVFREMLFGGRGHNPFSEWNPEENTQALRRSDNPDTSNRGVLVVVAACNLGDQMKDSAIDFNAACGGCAAIRTF